MNRHSVRLIAAAFAVAGLAGCFDDPTSSLRNGPDVLSLSRTAMAVTNGDSVLVEAFVRDGQGNALPATGATWTTDDATVAEANVAATQTPSDGNSRAYVLATSAVGGITYVRVTIRGLTDSVRVTSLPGTLPVGLATLSGTPRADTLPTGAFTAADTVTIVSGATLTFDGATSVVRFGTNPAYLLSRTASSIKVLSRGPFRGRPMVTNVTYPGNAQTGPILFDSIATGDVLDVARARLFGTTTVTGDTVTVTATAPATFTATSSLWLGPTPTTVILRTGVTQIKAIAPLLATASYTGGVNVRSYVVDGTITVDSVYSATGFTVARAAFPGTVAVTGSILMTITAPAGTTFSTSGANLSAVRFGATAASVISRTATQLQVSSSINYTGPVTVTNLLIGTVRVDSLKTIANSTIARATFGGAITQTGTNLLNQITVNTAAGVAFSTGASPSQVVVGGQNALVLSRTATQMVVIPAVPGTLSAITNVDVGGTIFPSLVPLNAVPAVTSTTGEANEPANGALAGATAVAFTGALDTITVYGSVDCQDDGTACPGNGDWQDWYSFSLSGTASIRAILEFIGNGAAGNDINPALYCTNPVDHLNPDIDVSIRTSAGAGVARTGGAGLVQPEISSTNAAQAAGTYTVRVDAFCTATPISYRLRILRF